MRKLFAIGAFAALAVPLQAMAVDTANWTQWTSDSAGSFVQNGSTVNVTYSGTNGGVSHDSSFYDVPSSFTNAQVTNTPGSNGTIIMTGGDTSVNNFHFSKAVIDPLMVVFSVGQGGVAVPFNFLGSVSFDILAQG